jgi:hypothetical protein
MGKPMPASLRVIKIVKDPYTHEEAFTVEFECESEDAADLMKELAANPVGKQLMEFLNKAEFLPKEPDKTEEELRLEAEAEDKAIREREAQLKEEGRQEGRAEIRKRFNDYFKRKYGIAE